MHSKLLAAFLHLFRPLCNVKGWAGMQETTLFDEQGFKPINAKNKIMQPAYAPSHFVLLTNAGIPSWHFHDSLQVIDSDLTVLSSEVCVEDYVTVQAAQLLYSPKDPPKEGCIKLEFPIAQKQNNGSDCGFAVCSSMINLYLGKDLEQTVIEPSELRKSFLNFLKSNDVKAYKYRQRMDKDEALFSCEPFAHRILKIAIICHCRMPREVAKTFYCAKCKTEFHLCCYLFGDSLKNQIDIFIKAEGSLWCYSCRGYQVPPMLDDSSDHSPELKQEIETMSPANFRRLWKNSCKNILVKKVARTDNACGNMAEIVKSHNLESIMRIDKFGTLSCLLKKIQRHVPQNERVLTIAELFHLLLLVSCEIEKVTIFT